MCSCLQECVDVVNSVFLLKKSALLLAGVCVVSRSVYFKQKCVFVLEEFGVIV